MAVKDCLARARKVDENKRLTDNDILNRIRYLENARNTLATQQPLENLKDFIKRQVNELKRKALVQKRETAFTILREREMRGRLLLLRGQGLNSSEALTATLTGLGKRRVGTQLSQDNLAKSMTEHMWGLLNKEISRHEGLADKLLSKSMDEDVVTELWNIGKPESGSTGNADALIAAKALAYVDRYGKDKMNSVGADIRFLQTVGHIPQTGGFHETGKLLKAKSEAWVRDVSAWVDPERMMIDRPEKINTILDDVYRGIVFGRQRLLEEGKTVAITARDLATSVSGHRVLAFKGPKEMLAYYRKYGSGKSVMELFVEAAESDGKNYALLRFWGPRPEQTFIKMRDEALEKAKRDKDEKLVNKLQSPRLQNEWNAVSGAFTPQGSPLIANIGKYARMAMVFSKLGLVLPSSFNDLSGMALGGRYNGVNILEVYGETIQRMTSKITDTTEKRHFASMLGVASNVFTGSSLARVSAYDTIPGRAGRAMHNFLKLTGIHWWTDSLKEAFGLSISHRLGLDRGTSFGSLNAYLMETLLQYNITERNWDFIRKNTETLGPDGKHYIAPDAIRQISDEAVLKELSQRRSLAGLKQEQVKELSDDFRMQRELELRSYLIGETNLAVLTPSAKERAFMLGSSAPGTALGEFARFFWQFKSFSLAIGARIIPRIVNGAPGGKFDYRGLTQYLAGSLLWGYIGLTAKDMIKGRTPRDPREFRTMSSAFLAGGGAGIYGDFLFGEYNRYGRGVIETLGGPVLGESSDLLKILYAARTGEDIGAKSVRFAINNAPYANLLFTRTALNYLFLYSLQDTMNPGYLRRSEKNLREDTGQEFLYPPSRIHARPFGR